MPGGKWCGFDPDEIFAYPTPKVVVMKDRYLGLLRIGLMVFIFFYIFIFTILFKGAHLRITDIEGVNRLTLRHPTKDLCDPFLLGCEAAFIPMTELSYCSESNSGKDTAKECQYWDYVESGMPSDGGMSIPTRVRRFHQERGCIPSASNKWQCTDNGKVLYRFEDVANGGLQIAGSSMREATPVYDVYLADIEHYTILLDHGFRNILGLALNDFSMNGYWLECPSPQAATAECTKHKVVCGHSECPKDATGLEGEEAEELKAKQQRALKAAMDGGSSSFVAQARNVRGRRGNQQGELHPQPESLPTLAAEDDGGFDDPMENPVAFHDSELLPGDFEGFPAAANKIGDVFDIDSILKMGGIDMDAPAMHGHRGTRREQGFVIVIQIEYTNMDEKNWLGLKITPWDQGPKPVYYYRVFTTAAGSYRFSKSYNDPSDAKRIMRVYNGMRIVIEQTGKIASWSISSFLVTFTSALGLLAVATTLTEVVMLNLMARKEFYKRKKFAHSKDLNDEPEEEADADAAVKPPKEQLESAEQLICAIEQDDAEQVYKLLKDMINQMNKDKN